MDKLAEASAAEAEAASAVWQAVQASSATHEETSVSDDNSQATDSEGSEAEADVRLHPRAVCFFCSYDVSIYTGSNSLRSCENHVVSDALYIGCSC